MNRSAHLASTAVLVALLGAAGPVAAASQLPLVTPETASADSSWVLVHVESDPEGAAIFLDGTDTGLLAPSQLEVEPGRHRLELQLEGHSGLNHEFEETAGSEFRLQFLLLRDRPERPTAEEMGLSYEPLVPLEPEESASTTLEKFLTVAETFSVLPLGAGVWLKVADQDESGANYLIGGGLSLTLGSLFMGRELSSRRLAGIRRENERIREANSIANVNNTQLERSLDQHLREDLAAWEVEVISRGRVLVLPMEDPDGGKTL